MQNDSHTKHISRRELLGYGLAALGVIWLPGTLSCNDSGKKDKNENKNKANQPVKTEYTKHELFLHSKTQALHYPALFKKYPALPEKFIRKFPVSDWERLLDQEKAHFTKDRSAPIFEALALKELKNGFTDAAFSKSASVLARSFSADYAVQNKYNWRGHDLLLQLVALDGSKAAEQKYPLYKTMTAAVDLASIKKIPKRNNWLLSQAEFDKRVQLILSRKEEFQQKLSKRIT